MIVTGDVATILVRDCEKLGITTYRKGYVPESTSERIIVIAKPQLDGTYWRKGFVEVNMMVPDVKGVANLSRLNQLERIAKGHFESVGEYDGTTYSYSIESIGQEEDTSLKCHYVNVRILFQTLNC